jgi:hypothetical protein
MDLHAFLLERFALAFGKFYALQFKMAIDHGSEMDDGDESIEAAARQMLWNS